MMQTISLDEVLAIHAAVIQRYGGPDGLRDLSIIQAALSHLQGDDVFNAIAAMGEAFINGQAFVNGNKRVGFAAMAMALHKNQYFLDKGSELDDKKFVLGIMNRVLDVAAISRWLKDHSIGFDEFGA